LYLSTLGARRASLKQVTFLCNLYKRYFYYLCQGGYVFVVVCLSVCLSVSNFEQKLLNGFAWNFQGRLAMG